MAYSPTGKDKAWTENLIGMAADGALWGTSFGAYRFDKKDKRLRLTEIFDERQREDVHSRIKAVFASIGWEVVE